MVENSTVLWNSTRSKFRSALNQAVEKLQSELEIAAVDYLGLLH